MYVIITTGTIFEAQFDTFTSPSKKSGSLLVPIFTLFLVPAHCSYPFLLSVKSASNCQHKLLT